MCVCDTSASYVAKENDSEHVIAHYFLFARCRNIQNLKLVELARNGNSSNNMITRIFSVEVNRRQNI